VRSSPSTFTLFSLLGGLAQNGGELIAARAAQGWRWVLFVNVPIGIALLAGSLVSLTESTGGHANRRLDLASAVTVTVTGGMALVVFGIVNTGSYAWTLANIQSTAVGAVVFGSYFFVSLYLQDVKHYSPLRTGLAFLPMGLMTFAGALVASRLVNRLGIRRQLVIAPLVTAAAVFWLSQWACLRPKLVSRQASSTPAGSLAAHLAWPYRPPSRPQRPVAHCTSVARTSQH
jgi:predicted MFS family arabinose efflux permease